MGLGCILDPQKGTLVCVLAPTGAVKHVLEAKRGRLVTFAIKEGALACGCRHYGHEGVNRLPMAKIDKSSIKLRVKEN